MSKYLHFQQKAIEIITHRFNEGIKGQLLADEMGLGKTIEAIGIINKLNVSKVLIVCPNSVKSNWMRELCIWLDCNLTIHTIQSGKKIIKSNIYIANYEAILESVKKDKENVKKPVFQFLYEQEFDLIILDECHYLQSYKSKRTKSASKLCKNAKYILAMSGTPIRNRPRDLFPILNILDQKTFKDFYSYGIRYCNGKKDRFGWDFTGASNINELSVMLKNSLMLRREVKDVYNELPDLQRTLVEIDARKNINYKSIVYNIKNKINEGKIEDVVKHNYSFFIHELQMLMKECFNIKKKQLISFCDDILQSGEKLVIFTYHREYAKDICLNLQAMNYKCDYFSGEVSVSNRTNIIQSFQDGMLDSLVLTMSTGGEGINLTKARNVVISQLDWTPSTITQCEKRLHRIGQKSKVNAYYFIIKNSIESYMMYNVINKFSSIDTILNKYPDNNNMLLNILKFFEV